MAGSNKVFLQLINLLENWQRLRELTVTVYATAQTSTWTGVCSWNFKNRRQCMVNTRCTFNMLLLYLRLEKYASTVLVQCMHNMPWTREIWDGNWDRESSGMKTIGAPLGPRTARFTLSPGYLHKVLAECKIERTYFCVSFVYSLDLASHSNRYQHFRNHHL